jgi:hypothetical protein
MTRRRDEQIDRRAQSMAIHNYWWKLYTAAMLALLGFGVPVLGLIGGMYAVLAAKELWAESRLERIVRIIQQYHKGVR